MKKIAIIFIPILFALHFPLDTHRLIPNDWIETYEQGKKVAQLFITFYRSQTETTNPKSKQVKAEARIPAPRPLIRPDILLLAQIKANAQVKNCEKLIEITEIKVRRAARVRVAM